MSSVVRRHALATNRLALSGLDRSAALLSMVPTPWRRSQRWVTGRPLIGPVTRPAPTDGGKTHLGCARNAARSAYARAGTNRKRGVSWAKPGHINGMTVYVAWTSADLHQLDPSRDLAGPWREVIVAAGGLAFVDSDDTLSRVYHALKWSLPDGVAVAVAVAPVADLPKAKGLEPGTNRWLRTRLR